MTQMSDRQLQTLTVSDAFDDVAPDIAAWLRSPAMVERWHATLRHIAVDLERQLSDYRVSREAGGPDREEWRTKALRVKRRVDRRLKEVKPLLAALNASRRIDAAADPETNWYQVACETRRAIHAHRDATLGDDFEPTEHDLALWATVEEARRPVRTSTAVAS